MRGSSETDPPVLPCFISRLNHFSHSHCPRYLGIQICMQTSPWLAALMMAASVCGAYLVLS